MLTAIGIRAILEAVCKGKNAKGKELYKKIDYLIEKGILTENIFSKNNLNIFHELRILGNYAAHEIKAENNDQISSALKVIEHLLQGLYILPYYGKKIGRDI